MTDIEYLKKYLSDDKLEEGIIKLKKGIPVQYIVGNVDFYGTKLKVNENVLIPRFETEFLVEKTIRYVNDYLSEPFKIIDLGTGSGAIAITLCKHLTAEVDAIDISLKALEVARENAKLNKVDVKFFQSDMFENVSGKYDLIISNPPYIAYDEFIEEVVRKNEPHIALYAKNGGLECYETILKNAEKFLNSPGIIAFEIGMLQADRIELLARKYLDNIEISKEKDLTGKDRYIFIFKK